MTFQPRWLVWRSMLLPLLVLLIVGAVALGAWSLLHGRNAGRDDRERAVAAPMRVAIESGQLVVKLDPATQQRAGIEIAPARSAPYREELRAYGTVLDLTRLTELTNNYATAKAQVQMAQAKLAASRGAFERSQRLYRDQQNVSAAQLQAAEAAFRSDQAALAAAEGQIKTLDATARQEWGPVLGQALVDDTAMVQRLIERKDFLVQVTLPSGVILASAPASAAAQAPSRSRVDLRYVSPATRTDPRIQGLSFFYTAPGDSSLLPGMNVLALLPSDKTLDGAVVPESAVVRWMGKSWIYLRTDEQTFARREIESSLPVSDGGDLVIGLPADAELVTRGAQTLLSEELKSQLRGGGDED